VIDDLAREKAREYVAAQIEQERKAINEQAARLKKGVPALQKTYDKAQSALSAIEAADPDTPSMSDKERLAARKMQAAGGSLRGQLAAIASAGERLRRLDDPAEIERRVNARYTRSTYNNNRRGGGDMPARTEREPAREVPQDVVDRIVSEINDGTGLVTVTKKLNTDGVPAGGRAKQWYPVTVRDVYLKATGADNLKTVRAEKPLASRKASDRPPRETTKLDRPKQAASLEELVAAEQVEYEKQHSLTDTGHVVTQRVKREAKPDPKPKTSGKKRRAAARAKR
jgi:hypothetical protein